MELGRWKRYFITIKTVFSLDFLLQTHGLDIKNGGEI